MVCLCVFSELVVAESVVVIKKLLQMQPEQHSDIIKHMAKLIDNIQVELRSKLPVFTSQTDSSPDYVCGVCVCVRQVPMARASILWLIGEYCEHVPKIAPDVLRKMAKTSITRKTLSSCRLSIWLPNCTSLTQNRWGTNVVMASFTKEQCYLILLKY